MYLARTERGLTRAALAAEIKQHASVIGDLEAARRSPGRRLSLTIQTALGVDPSWWDEEPSTSEKARYERVREKEMVARGRKDEAA